MGKVKELKICKCGHLKIDHKEKPDSKLSLPNECKKCKCNSYLNRNLPNKVGFGIMLYGCVTIAFAVIASIMTYSLAVNIWDKTIKITVGNMTIITIGIFMIGALMIYLFVISDYFSDKRRKTYPIEDGENQK